MDLLLDKETGDMIFINGQSPVTEDLRHSVEQGLTIALKTLLGEWFLDTDVGVPYFEKIFKKQVNKEAVDIVFQEQILKDIRVSQITEFDSDLTGRVYTCNFRVKCIDGSITDFITVNPLA